MATCHYHCVDVFTERAFGGNQLTVSPDASGLTDVRMQLIARQLNLSETTFVFPADESNHTCKVRIFTPIAELPFAGHPTLGTAHVLVENSAAFESESTMELVLEETIGPVPVSILKRRMGTTFQHFSTSMMPEYGPPSPPAADLAGLLNIARATFFRTNRLRRSLAAYRTSSYRLTDSTSCANYDPTRQTGTTYWEATGRGLCSPGPGRRCMTARTSTHACLLRSSVSQKTQRRAARLRR